MSAYDLDVFSRDFLQPILDRLGDATGEVIHVGEPFAFERLAAAVDPSAAYVDVLLGYEAGRWLTHPLARQIFELGEPDGRRLLVTFGDIAATVRTVGGVPGEGYPLDSSRPVQDGRDFLLACGAAMEDAASPARRECLRILRHSTSEEFATRIAALDDLTEGIRAGTRRQLSEPDAVRVLLAAADWSLDGRECAVDDWDSPANWRTSAALTREARYRLFDDASTALARAAIEAVSGPPGDIPGQPDRGLPGPGSPYGEALDEPGAMEVAAVEWTDATADANA